MDATTQVKAGSRWGARINPARTLPRWLHCCALLATVQAAMAATPDETGGTRREADLGGIANNVIHLHDAVETLDVDYVISRVGGDDLHVINSTRHSLNVEKACRRRYNCHLGIDEHLDTDRNVQIWSPERMVAYDVTNRIVQIGSAKYAARYSWKIRLDPLLEYVGWWPKADTGVPERQSQAGCHIHLRHLLASGEYFLRDGKEFVDGAACLVLQNEGASDILWLDSERQWAIRQRVWHDRRNRGQFLTYRTFELKSYLLDQNDTRIWLPSRVETEETQPDQRIERRVVNVERMVINKPDTKRFEFTPDPGSLIWDLDSGTHTATAGGEDLLEKNVQIVKSNHPTAANHRDNNEHVIELAGIVVAISASVLLMAWFSRKRL